MVMRRVVKLHAACCGARVVITAQTRTHVRSSTNEDGVQYTIQTDGQPRELSKLLPFEGTYGTVPVYILGKLIRRPSRVQSRRAHTGPPHTSREPSVGGPSQLGKAPWASSNDTPLVGHRGDPSMAISDGP